MDNDTLQHLREEFEGIRDERNTHANTATRIGNAFLSLLGALGNWAGSFLRKDQDDETNFFITFLKGVFFGHYTPGALGTGGAVTIDENGNSSAEFDFLTIRKAATFRSITILELKHIGGELGITAGAMKVSRVEELNDAYRCYFETSDGKKQVYQEFVVGDQARCQQFRLSQNADGMLSTKYYWRLVTNVGTNFIDLSKDDADTASGVPQEGDEIIQLGYRDEIGGKPLPSHPERQSVIILSAVADDAPSVKYYQGINSYNLTGFIVKDEGYDPESGVFHSNVYGDFYVGHQNGHVSYNSKTRELDITGKVKMTSGSMLDGNDLSTLIGNIDKKASDAQSDATAAQQTAQAASDSASAACQAATAAGQAAADAADSAEAANQTAETANDNATQAINIANSLSTGNGNLLRNSGFTGDYLPESVAPTSEVDPGTPMYSDPFDHWGHENAEVVVSAESVTGSAAVLTNGSLQQTLEIGVEAGKPYVFSFKGKGTSLQFSVGGFSQTVALNNTVERYNVKFTAASSGTAFAITGSTCTVMELQLIEGNIPFNNWVNHPKDNDKSLARFQNFTYLLNAIVNGRTEILGGLILSDMMKVGNYRNNQPLTEQDETGGMSGLYNNPDSPFLWGGGSLSKAFYTIAKYTENPNYEPTDEELANEMAQFVVTHGGMAILNNIIARGAIFATSGVFKNITSPYGKFRIDNEGNMTVRDATISGNMYAPMLSITPENFAQYTNPEIPGSRTLLLALSGLNVKFEGLDSYTAIRLPGESQYLGAIARIYNNTISDLSVVGVIGTYAHAGGTEKYFETQIRSIDIRPNSYQTFQCQYFSPYSYSEFVEGHQDIEHDSSMQTIVSGLTVGDVVEISCGIVKGNGGYKVMAGSKTLVDTINIEMVSERMAGRVFQHKVVANQTIITANVADGSTLSVVVNRRNRDAGYFWTQVSESNIQDGAKDLGIIVRMEGVNGPSVGYDPYITDDGYLRFRTWTRPDDDSAIHSNG